MASSLLVMLLAGMMSWHAGQLFLADFSSGCKREPCMHSAAPEQLFCSYSGRGSPWADWCAML